MMTAAMKERGEKLRAVVAALDSVPVTWGEDDCSTFPASWVAGITGRDVWWPSFDSEEAARALIEQAGGLLPLWEEIAAEVGLRKRVPGEEPQLGDIGLITTTYHDKHVGVVFAAARVACWRHTEGVRRLTVRHSSIAAAWEVP